VARVLKSLENIGVKNSEIATSLKEMEERLSATIKGDREEPSIESTKQTFQDALDMVRDGVILEMLHFSNLGRRFEDLRNAHEGTFDWIFSNPEMVLEKEPGLKITFPAWLQTGSGIFHIAGKPGSGKSTLMKYLCRHKDREELLTKWAEGYELLFAKFFFWRIGTSQEEKSLKGLVRGLLYELLCKVPALARVLFPKSWAKASQAVQRHLRTELSADEIIDGFTEFVKVSASPDQVPSLKRIRVCLFIDGLDEFDESGFNETHGQLIEKLLLWTGSSNGNVKMCVSSRVQSPFMERLESEQRITLDRLTRGDVELVVRSQLENHQKFRALKRGQETECEALLQEVITAAEGVFLWVALLLNSLSKGLDKDDPIELLRSRVANTPKELDSFLATIVDGIEPIYRKGADLLLAIILRTTGTLLSSGNRAPDHALFDEAPFPHDAFSSQDVTHGEEFCLSVLSCFLILRATDKGKPMANFELSDLDSFEKFCDDFSHEQIKKAMHSAVISRCNGLVEIVRGSFVKFMHRSIPEFLHRHFERNSQPHRLDDYQTTLGLTWGYLVETKCIEATQLRPYPEKTSLVAHLLGVHASTDNGDDEPLDYQYPEEFGRNNNRLFVFLCRLRQMRLDQQWTDLFRLLLSIDRTLRRTWGTHIIDNNRWLQTAEQAKEQYRSLLCLSGFIGLYEFIDWVFRQSDTFENSEYLFNVMRSAVSAFESETTIFSQEVMETMFKHGTPADMVFPDTSGIARKTMWHAFLLQNGPYYYEPIRSKVVEIWLRHGANPHVSFRTNAGSVTSIHDIRDVSANMSLYEICRFHGKSTDRVSLSPDAHISLRGMVELFHPHNERALLDLIGDDIDEGNQKPEDNSLGASAESDPESTVETFVVDESQSTALSVSEQDENLLAKTPNAISGTELLWSQSYVRKNTLQWIWEGKWVWLYLRMLSPGLAMLRTVS
jgi:hypothetical protein